jgi:hypothetical protein
MVLAMLCVGMFVSSGFGGITFGNVDGAYGWTWVESEAATSSVPGATPWYANGYSGWAGGNDSCMLFNGSGDATYDYTVPVAMTNAKMFVQAVSQYNDDYRWNTIHLGDATTPYIGWFNLYQPLKIYESVDLGSFAAGDVQMTVHQGGYDSARMDGFFLSNGPLVSSGVTLQDSTYRMTAPSFAGALPVIDKAPFAPTISGGPMGATVWVNGIQIVDPAYLISVPGDYNLVVKGAAGDILSGASFSYVPEPASLSLLALSVLGLLRRRHS